MKSAQIGSAECAPSRFSSRLSSNPTQTTQSRLLVNPANQPSCEVPVFPAAGRLKPRAMNPRAGAVSQDVLHHVDHEIGHARIERIARGRPGVDTAPTPSGARTREMVVGVTCEPSFAKTVYAPAISSGVVSYAPSATAGVALIASFSPTRCAIAHDFVVSHLLRQLNRRDVQRMRQRRPQRHRSHEILWKLLG